MRFRDRADAGRKLAAALGPILKPPCVIAGIPRGGVAVALPIAEQFHVPLTVVYARKLTAPIAPECAFGAIDEDDHALVEARSVELLELSPPDIERAKDKVSKEIRRRMETYGAPALAHYLPDAAVVLVDDGLATGLTMRAALQYARRHGAREVIVAVPCASEPAAREFEQTADHFVSLLVDPDFMAVGQYYSDFSPVSDDEVIAMLTDARGAAAPGAREKTTKPTAGARPVRIPAGTVAMQGDLILPDGGHGIVVFAHGSGSSRHSPRNRYVAGELRKAGLGTLLMDLLTLDEEAVDARTSHLRFDIPLLASRLVAATDWLLSEPATAALSVGYFGASTGAAAALVAAAERPEAARAIVSRGGRPDLAGAALGRVKAPTLLIVGGHDEPVIEMNRDAMARMRSEVRLEIVPGATHLFEEPGTLEIVARLAREWFAHHLG
jgi:putative phosphoribosyl transferase